MTICFFGIYDRNYSRNRVILKGLSENNIKVIEINDRTTGLLKYINLIIKFFKNKEKFDYIWVAFPGQLCVLLAKILSSKKIIFDAFTSHYQGLVEDRKIVRRNSWLAQIYYWLDKYSCKMADYIVLDTNEHIKYFANTFNLKQEKFFRLFVSSDDSVFYPKPEGDLVSLRETKSPSSPFIVHWHGHYIPLQGAEIIIEAARILKDNSEVIFNMIGRGQEFAKCQKLAESYSLSNINFIGNLSYGQLADYLAVADIALGIFSNTHKAAMVIPNKIYEAMAMRKALITEYSPAAAELLIDRENVLFCQPANPHDLADKILELKNNFILKEKIAENSYKLFVNILESKKIIKDLLNNIENNAK